MESLLWLWFLLPAQGPTASRWMYSAWWLATDGPAAQMPNDEEQYPQKIEGPRVQLLQQSATRLASPPDNVDSRLVWMGFQAETRRYPSTNLQVNKAELATLRRTKAHVGHCSQTLRFVLRATAVGRNHGTPYWNVLWISSVFAWLSFR